MSREHDWLEVVLDQKVPLCPECRTGDNITYIPYNFAYLCGNCRTLTGAERMPTVYPHQLEGR